MLFIGYYNFGEFYIFCNVGKLCCNRLACNMQKKKEWDTIVCHIHGKCQIYAY